MDNNILKVTYTLFLGLIITLFITFGIATFYPRPAFPEFPQTATVYKAEPTPSEAKQMEEASRKFDQENRVYMENIKVYSRNVVIITTIAAVVLLVGSLLLERFSTVIANGMLVAGIFTLLYGIANGFEAGDSRYQFIAVTIGLMVALFLGYRRFTKAVPAKKKQPKKKR